jgi:hypothetical protein
MKIKIFETNQHPTTTAKLLEGIINEWLESEKPTIVKVLQTDTRHISEKSSSQRYFLTITFLYE